MREGILARLARLGWVLCYHGFFMTAHVYVSLKKTVLDPQGETIRAALAGLGFQGVEAVRQGKHFEIQLNSHLSPDEARAEVERIAKEVLTNPVIEEFSYRLETGSETVPSSPKQK
jgi:phosphoribosylformylglycinamidine synthase subunit PurS